MKSAVRVHNADFNKELETVRLLFKEYASGIGFDLAFQDFEQEVNNLPGDYDSPGGRVLIAESETEVAGCVALRDLGEGICEMKRLFVQPEFRGRGIGRRLSEELLKKARALGYSKMRLDTVPSMKSARALYTEIGFREIGPYRFNPIPGASFMEIDL